MLCCELTRVHTTQANVVVCKELYFDSNDTDQATNPCCKRWNSMLDASYDQLKWLSGFCTFYSSQSLLRILWKHLYKNISNSLSLICLLWVPHFYESAELNNWVSPFFFCLFLKPVPSDSGKWKPWLELQEIEFDILSPK